MDWISPKDRLPPQGKKILYFDNGDVYVVQRFGEFWLPIPFTDSKYAILCEPQLWSDIHLPEPFTGRVYVSVKNSSPLDIDSLEREHPRIYHEFKGKIIENIVNCNVHSAFLNEV